MLLALCASEVTPLLRALVLLSAFLGFEAALAGTPERPGFQPRELQVLRRLVVQVWVCFCLLLASSSPQPLQVSLRKASGGRHQLAEEGQLALLPHCCCRASRQQVRCRHRPRGRECDALSCLQVAVGFGASLGATGRWPVVRASPVSPAAAGACSPAVVALVVVVAVARRRVKLSLLYHRHEKRELQELEALKSLEGLKKRWTGG